MNTYTWVGSAPNCSECGCPMREWYMFAETHTHDECLMRRIKKEMSEFTRQLFERNPLPPAVVEALKNMAATHPTT